MDGFNETDARMAILNAPVDLDATAKAYSTLQARAALAGWQLVQMPAGDFVIERWGAVRALSDAAAVEAFLRQVGAPA